MVYIVGMVVLVFGLTVEARVGDSSESSFCTETKECLLYDSVCKGDGYEVRHYETSRWVSVDGESFSMDMALAKAFWKVFKYIRGANDAGEKIEMTSPVIVKTQDGTTFWQSSVFTISFLLPSIYQKDNQPPTPTDSDVYINEMPDMKVYVRSYGGWMMGLTTRMQSRSLRQSLNAAGASYTDGYHYNVGYNSPMTMTNRHNEVWYIAEGEPVCPK